MCPSGSAAKDAKNDGATANTQRVSWLVDWDREMTEWDVAGGKRPVFLRRERVQKTEISLRQCFLN